MTSSRPVPLIFLLRRNFNFTGYRFLEKIDRSWKPTLPPKGETENNGTKKLRGIYPLYQDRELKQSELTLIFTGFLVQREYTMRPEGLSSGSSFR